MLQMRKTKFDAALEAAEFVIVNDKADTIDKRVWWTHSKSNLKRNTNWAKNHAAIIGVRPDSDEIWVHTYETSLDNKPEIVATIEEAIAVVVAKLLEQ